MIEICSVAGFGHATDRWLTSASSGDLAMVRALVRLGEHKRWTVNYKLDNGENHDG